MTKHDECLTWLLSLRPETYSEAAVDAGVHGYLAGFKDQSRAERESLAADFRERAEPSELTETIYRQIMA